MQEESLKAVHAGEGSHFAGLGGFALLSCEVMAVG